MKAKMALRKRSRVKTPRQFPIVQIENVVSNKIKNSSGLKRGYLGSDLKHFSNLGIIISSILEQLN
jgi:hypothetical protein